MGKPQKASTELPVQMCCVPWAGSHPGEGLRGAGRGAGRNAVRTERAQPQICTEGGGVRKSGGGRMPREWWW